MPTARDLKLSRKMQKILRKTADLIEKEMGEPMGVGLIVFPWAQNAERPDEIVEFQYVSNAPRHFMHDRLKRLTRKWDAGHDDVPPHEKN